jgi:hypothetical protein
LIIGLKKVSYKIINSNTYKFILGNLQKAAKICHFLVYHPDCRDEDMKARLTIISDDLLGNRYIPEVLFL